MTDANSRKPSKRRSSSRKPQGRPRPPERVAKERAAPPGEQSEEPRKPIPPLPPLATGESFEVSESVAGNTVLAVLRAVRPGESWSKLRGQVERSFVSLNGVVCVDEARRVAVGDVLVLGDRPRSAPPQASDVKIQYVDAHIVVVEKPAGMMTHRRPEERNWSAERKARQPTLDEALNELLIRRGAASGRSRLQTGSVRCVHRLDRDTSGVLVFARSQVAETGLVSQFRKHTVHRVYWAIVRGRPKDGIIVSNLVKDRGDGRRGSVQNPVVGQRAVTHIRWLEKLGDYSLVECQLETGRTNQIRIHLAEAGHMICGDPKYNQPYGEEAIRDDSGAPRLALHAAELGFVHPVSGEEMFFQMPFPPELQRFVDRIRRPK